MRIFHIHHSADGRQRVRRRLHFAFTLGALRSAWPVHLILPIPSQKFPVGFSFSYIKICKLYTYKKHLHCFGVLYCSSFGIGHRNNEIWIRTSRFKKRRSNNTLCSVSIIFYTCSFCNVPVNQEVRFSSSFYSVRRVICFPRGSWVCNIYFDSSCFFFFFFIWPWAMAHLLVIYST